MILATIKKNAVEEIRVELVRYKGSKLVGVRVYREPAGQHEKVPTRKGITFRPHCLPELLRALGRAAVKSGVIDMADVSGFTMPDKFTLPEMKIPDMDLDMDLG